MSFIKRLRKTNGVSAFVTIKNSLFSKFLKNKHTGDTLLLKHNTIYVLPSKMGAGFLFVAILNFILGINYQNNLILAMAYLMLVMLVLAILIGYSNVKGVKISFKTKHDDYSPISPRLHFDISTTKLCQSFMMIYKNSQVACLDSIDKSSNVTVALPYTHRGCFALERIKLLSHYPFGLVSVWSYMQINETVYVYPEQIDATKNDNLVSEADNSQGDLKRKNGNEEFDSLADHQHGMGLQRVSWKHYAKTQQLMVKEFINFASTPMTYDYALLQGNTESRLSQLSFFITQAHINDHPYALKLNNEFYPMAKGRDHLVSCLIALSRFTTHSESDDATHS
ncbi:DUF58 domain-containing protein [Pseudoalteromonas shioyasakiensis]|uniref:DUF58 domain-containing protein n=1 Tax=Pseudoalteromonas shioyasakiensis TaxID=1190813 RepID=UPI0021189FC2|nr:DUF58 domain-containing protein [Pseudoalteromonas shioyasakiensis]MCQ8876716.1 DUF58 domain-containing protein [Pseudoalteromonas shioyasakiensis]